jgi:hypothetical protein
MPDGATRRETDEYAWARGQAELIALGRARRLDLAGIREHLEEMADEMLATVKSHLVNILAHASKAAWSNNREVVGHWRTEITEFRDQLLDAYKPSMRQRIDMQELWERAMRKVGASFRDHGEPPPAHPAECPYMLDEILDPDLDVDQLVERIRR